MHLIGSRHLEPLQCHRRIHQLDILHLIRLQSTHLWLDLENIILNYCLFVCLFFSGLSRVSPKLLFHFVIRWKFEDIIKWSSASIANSDEHLSRLRFILSRNIPQIPIVLLQTTLQCLRLREGESLDLQILFLIVVQPTSQLFVDLWNLEVLPQRSHTQDVIADIDYFHQGIVTLGQHPHLAFQGRLTALQLQSAPLWNPFTSTHHQFQVVLLHLTRAEEDGDCQLRISGKSALFEVQAENRGKVCLWGRLVALLKTIIPEMQVDKKWTICCVF